MPGANGDFIQGYNAQAVVEQDSHMVVASARQPSAKRPTTSPYTSGNGAGAERVEEGRRRTGQAGSAGGGCRSYQSKENVERCVEQDIEHRISRAQPGTPQPAAGRSSRCARSTRTPASCTRRSMSWRISTKPEQFSSGAPWCSSTTTRGFARKTCTCDPVARNRNLASDLLPSKALRRSFTVVGITRGIHYTFSVGTLREPNGEFRECSLAAEMTRCWEPYWNTGAFICAGYAAPRENGVWCARRGI